MAITKHIAACLILVGMAWGVTSPVSHPLVHPCPRHGTAVTYAGTTCSTPGGIILGFDTDFYHGGIPAQFIHIDRNPISPHAFIVSSPFFHNITRWVETVGVWLHISVQGANAIQIQLHNCHATDDAVTTGSQMVETSPYTLVQASCAMAGDPEPWKGITFPLTPQMMDVLVNFNPGTMGIANLDSAEFYVVNTSKLVKAARRKVK